MSLPRSPTGVPYWPDGQTAASAAARPSLRARVFGFLALFLLLQGAYTFAQGTRVERWVIDEATVGTAAWLIDRIAPEVGVQAVGSRLRAPGGGINILNGCEGVEVVFLVAAAMLVAPLAWRWKVLGLWLGTGWVFALNQVRVLALFFAYRHDQGWFDVLHGVVAPLVLIAATAAFFLVWLDRCAGGAVHRPTHA